MCALDFAVPFDQWRLYPRDSSQGRIIRQLDLKKSYEEARHALAQVLYLARITAYASLETLTTKLGLDPSQVLGPMFAVRLPPHCAAIRRDAAESPIEICRWARVDGAEA